MAYVRMLMTAVDPSEVETIQRFFEDDVRPVMEKAEGCEWTQLLVSTEPNAGGLVDGCAMSRWDTEEHLAAALETRELQEALVRVRGLLRQEPVTRTFRVLE